MCGFLGQFNIPDFKENVFRELLSLSDHRGPDNNGYWTNGQIQLGFNRLAILDLTEAGYQPMISPNNKFVIVFNGEIYNHNFLRKKLPPYNYRGHSDTETITHALEVWGIRRTVEELDGMFALGIYEQETESIYLARDFAGIKPLFYGVHGKSLVFASQYDQVKEHPLFENASIDLSVLKLYLQQHFLPAPFGLHKGIYQVRPGEIIQFTIEGKQKTTRYWEMPSIVDYSIDDPNEAEAYIAKILDECVSDQLISDVPLGAFLSGGVDSPLVCSFAKKHKADLKVFSIGSDSKVHDESKRAALFADAMGLQQKLWKLDAKQTLSYWDEAMQSLHEPLADFSIIPTYLVSKLARKEATVVLSGDGGDELFFGYERFWSVGKNIRFQQWPKLVRMGLYGLDKYISGNKRLNSVLLSSSQGKAHEGLNSRFRDSWLNQVAPDLASVKLPGEWNVYNYPESTSERHLLGYMRKAEFYGMMQKTLRKVDLASMQNSLEVRVPFLQKKLIEASLQIDPMLSYGNGKKKQILKNLLNKSIPEVKDDGIKRGFSVPLSKWIREDLRQPFKERLLDGTLKDHGFNISIVENMLDYHNQSKQDLKWPLFTLYSLEATKIN